MQYWFRPKRFWRFFAAYYPATKEGWVVTLIIVAVAVGVFRVVDNSSHSVSDTLMQCAPWAIALGIVFDFACFRFGEYPSWWRRK